MNGAVTSLALVLLVLALGVGPQGGEALRAAPAAAQCTASTPATPSETEGPFYKSGSPERPSLLEDEMGATKLVVTGTVRSRGDCAPVPRAWLDFWQADDRGRYDNAGYRLRGHQYADGAGRYRLQTIVPGLYPGRTRHIHVKVRAAGGPTLTTQIYFPSEPRNQSDGLFNPALLADVQDGAGGKVATFNFVIDVR